MPNCLVLWDPFEIKLENEIKPRIESGLGKKIFQDYPSSSEFRDYYKKSFTDDRTILSGAINKCSFAVFSAWTPLSAKTIKYLRNAITQVS